MASVGIFPPIGPALAELITDHHSSIATSVQSCATWSCTNNYWDRSDAANIACGADGCTSYDCCNEYQPDVAVNQSLSPADGKILIGDNVTITVLLQNFGQWNAFEVPVTQTLVAGLEYIDLPEGKAAAAVARP